MSSDIRPKTCKQFRALIVAAGLNKFEHTISRTVDGEKGEHTIKLDASILPDDSLIVALHYGLKQLHGDAPRGARGTNETAQSWVRRTTEGVADQLRTGTYVIGGSSAEVTEACKILKDEGFQVDRKKVASWSALEAWFNKQPKLKGRSFEALREVATNDVAERRALQAKQKEARKF